MIEFNEWEASVLRVLIEKQRDEEWDTENRERMESIRKKLTPF